MYIETYILNENTQLLDANLGCANNVSTHNARSYKSTFIHPTQFMLETLRYAGRKNDGSLVDASVAPRRFLYMIFLPANAAL